jgi:ferric-dicitrate binding protein FerR (iron transport regulator)
VSQPSFDELFQKYINQTCTPEEVDQLFDLLENEEQGSAAKELLERHFQDELEPTGYTDEAMRERLQNRFQLIEQHIAAPRAKRVSLVWRWVAAAAVIVMLAGSGVWYWLTSKTKTTIVSTKPSNEVMPGSDKAVLTLADGKTISLDSATHGTLGHQGHTTVNQQGGQLIYNAGETSHGEPVAMLYNTLTTPRGGQYQLTLPEGSKVWLNAASSIRFPAAINDSARVVYVTGEVYFEVKHQYGKNGKKIPFNVIVPSQPGGPGGAEIKVLGTHFNINAYEDEPYVTTTLLEGKVSINRPGIASPAFLLPGQQALLNPQAKQVQVINNADVKQVMAWKNGLFRFDGVELKTVMRQLARWYDVEITFEKGAPVSEPFIGVMQRSLQLSQVLKGMQAMGIHVKKEGRHLIVMP